MVLQLSLSACFPGTTSAVAISHDDDIHVVDLYVDVFIEFENVNGEVINFDSDSSIGAMKGLATAIRRRCART